MSPWVCPPPYLGRSLSIVCRLAGLCASGDSAVASSCLVIRALWWERQASTLVFYVAPADLNLGLLPCMARTLLTETSPQTFIYSFRSVLSALVQALAREQLRRSELPGALFLSPSLGTCLLKLKKRPCDPRSQRG